MFQQLAARVARPTATTFVTAAAAATASPSSAPARADAPRPSHQILPPLESSTDSLTVLAGDKGSGSFDGSGCKDVWSIVDSYGDISQEEVRNATAPVLSHMRSPSSGGDSDGFEADSIMHRTEGIINNVMELVNDPEFRKMALNHRAMKSMISSMKSGPLLLPDLTVPSPSSVRIEELHEYEDAGIKSPIEQLGEGLRFVGERLGKVWNGVGDFFKGLAAKLSGKYGDPAADEAAGEESIFNVMLSLAVLVFISIVAKRLGTGRA